jgi:hypothetical protein
MTSMEACRGIVEAFYRKREGVEDYVVRVDFEPNPLNYDGIDQVSACVVKKTRTNPTGEVILRAGGSFTLEEALESLAEAIDLLV